MALNSELMLFQPPVVNEGIEYLQWIECRPVNQITEDGSIDIHVKASGSQYLDLQRSRLYVKAKICERGWWKFGSCRCSYTCESVATVALESGGCLSTAKTSELFWNQLCIQSPDGCTVELRS